jgi:2-keto-4-pentenoate hydratase
MKKFKSALCGVLLIGLMSNLAQAHKGHEQQNIDQQLNRLAFQILTAYQNKDFKPLVSERLELNETQAYYIQKQLNQNLAQNQPIKGFKAGLTSASGQNKFGVKAPLAGALFGIHKVQFKNAFTSKDYKKLMLETEIGYVLSSDIAAFSKITQQDLPTLIEKVVPVIELPDLAYSNVSKVTGLDLIATNVASNEVLIGDFTLPKDFKLLNEVQTKMTRGAGTQAELLISGKGSDASGDQAQALHWLINQLLQSGYALKKGQLLITGALGAMVPAEKGTHLASFGKYGQITFDIR